MELLGNVNNDKWEVLLKLQRVMRGLINFLKVWEERGVNMKRNPSYI